MIGEKINWKNICKKYHVDSEAKLLILFRNKKHLPYDMIANRLGISKSAIWNKAMELLEKNKLTKKDLQKYRNFKE